MAACNSCTRNAKMQNREAFSHSKAHAFIMVEPWSKAPTLRAYIEGDASALNPRTFLLIVGSARSGTSAVSAIVDSHPAIVCANESDASEMLWRKMDGAEIKSSTVECASLAFANGRRRDDYLYEIRMETKRYEHVEILADKIYTPSLLFLHGDAGLLDTLSSRLERPVKIVYCLRDPMDVIATMHRRSGATLRDRARWYFNHCEALAALLDRGIDMTPVYHERLIADPIRSASLLFEAIGVPSPGENGLAAIRQMLFTRPSRTRDQVLWPEALRIEIAARIKTFSFLAEYDMAEVEQ